MRYLKGSLRLRVIFLVFLSLLPGLLLTVYSVILNEHHEVLVVLLIALTSLIVSWFGGDFLIVRNVNRLIALSKRLASGDLTARTGLEEQSGLLGKLAQAFDQMANSLEQRTVQLQQRADQVAALSETVSEFSIQQDFSTLLDLIVNKAMMLLDASRAVLTLFDPQFGDLEIVVVKGFQVPEGTRIPLGEGTIGRTAQTRQPLIVDQEHPLTGRLFEFGVGTNATLIELPMVYRDELIGVLVVTGMESARNYSQMEIHLLNLFAGIAASAIKNGRLFSETRRRLRELEVINEISTALRVAQNLDEILPLLLEKTMALVGANLGSIWLFDPAAHHLRQVISNGIPNFTLPLQLGEGITGMVFSTGQPYFTLDWREDPLTPDSIRQQIPSRFSAAFIPLRTALAAVGVLIVGFNALPTVSDEQIRLMTTIAEIAGNAIHRTQLHEQMRSQLRRLSALHQIDVAITSSLDLGNTLQVLLDQVVTQLGVDAACALVLNPHEQTLDFAASRGFRTEALRYTRLRFGEGYAGRAAIEQRIIHISDLRNRHTDFLRSPSFAAEGFVNYYAVPLLVRSQVKGVLEIFHRSMIEHNQDWLDFLEALASQAAIAIENASLFNELQRSNIELNLAYNTTLEGWSRALDLRDRETEGHSQRVTEISLRLARAMAVDEKDLIHIRRGALLHDIGKLGIPDQILLKPGPLSQEERAIIEKHPSIAFEMLAPIAYLRPALDIPYCHHEKWDGSGYPRGLKGEEIPLSARIFAVVDVWDALLSDRPYRKGWPEEKARAYLLEQAGRHFDSQVIDVFLSLLNEGKKGNESLGTE